MVKHRLNLFEAGGRRRHQEVSADTDRQVSVGGAGDRKKTFEYVSADRDDKNAHSMA